MKSKRIIVCFKENVSNDEIANWKTDSQKSGFEISRLHDIDNLLRLDNNYPIGDSTEKKEAYFSNLNLEGIEKRIYNTRLISSSNSIELEKLLREFQDSEDIEYAHEDLPNRLYQNSDDPEFNELWGLKLIQCKEAWEISKGKGVHVAVIDTGVNLEHSDIIHNLWKDDKKGNKGFAYFIGENENEVICSTLDNDIMDNESGHGTHVSGAIGAQMNNETDIVGVAPESKIVTFNCRDKNYDAMYDSLCARAIQDATMLKKNGIIDIKVMNISWGRKEDTTKGNAVIDAITMAVKEGITVVCAAGNRSDPADEYVPANHPDVICVGAIIGTKEKLSVSNYGNKITVAAPGNAILSLDKNVKKGTIYDFGTSMAAAYVSGVVALMLSANSNLTPADIKEILPTEDCSDLNTVTFTDKNNKSKTENWRLINALKCVQKAKKPSLV